MPADGVSGLQDGEALARAVVLQVATGADARTGRRRRSERRGAASRPPRHHERASVPPGPGRAPSPTSYTPCVYAWCRVARHVDRQTLSSGSWSPAPAHGYDLKRIYDERSATAGRCLRPGLLDPVPAAEERPRPRSTASSRATAPSASGTRSPRPASPTSAQWLAQPEKPEPYLQSTLYTKVVLALLTGRDAADMLDTQRAEHLRLMRELTRRKRERRPRRPAHLRPRPVPPGGRPALAGAHRRPPRPARQQVRR